MPNTSEIEVTRPPRGFVKWVGLAGLMVLAKGVMFGISGLVAIARDEAYLRGNNAVLLLDPTGSGRGRSGRKASRRVKLASR
jgi:hypothetical protein